MRLPPKPRLPSTRTLHLGSVLTLAMLNVFLAQLANTMPPTMREGDMAVAEVQGRQDSIQHSFVVANDSLWADGLVPFRFEKLKLVGGALVDLFSNKDMVMIRSVLAGITEAVPCVKFSEVADSYTGHCLIFTNSAKGCWSFVGQVGPQGGKMGQSLNLGQNCVHKGIVLHEVLHALGATHEQNRQDRDSFVKINQENIMENKMSNFDKKTEGFNIRGTPYDYQSIMHYKVTDFSKTGRVTMTPLKRNITLRERSELSIIDVVELSKVYEGITSTSCYSTVMLLRYAAQLETMISRTIKYKYACPEYALDFPGNDITHFNNIYTWEQCSWLCKRHKACSYWTWEPPRGDYRPDKCWLKYSAANVRDPSPDRISGVKSCYVH